MSEKISVLIADDNIEFGDLLKRYMDREEDIDVVGFAKDGIEACEMIASLVPDIVILDIIMPNLDGIGVLEKVLEARMEHKPLFLILSGIGQDKFVQKAIALGAEYYILKPFDIDILVSRIRQLFKARDITSFSSKKHVPRLEIERPEIRKAEFDLETEVTNLIRDVGIPAHMTGYQYIREAIIQSVGNSKSFTSVTRVLYPEIANRFNSTPQKVERAIRNAIESTWKRGKRDALHSLFGHTSSNTRGKPTNSEFIAAMADKINISKRNK